MHVNSLSLTKSSVGRGLSFSHYIASMVGSQNSVEHVISDRTSLCSIAGHCQITDFKLAGSDCPLLLIVISQTQVELEC